MKIKRLIAYLILGLFIILLFGCTAADTDELFRLKLSIEAEGQGKVTVNPLKTSYIIGEQVTLEAKPESGWTFERWDGYIQDTKNPITITLDRTSQPIIAIFSDKDATYTLKISWVGMGSVSVSPEAQTYLNGSQITLTATPDQGHIFAGWDGDLVGVTDNPVTFTITKNTEVTAIFNEEGVKGIQFGDLTLENKIREIIDKPTGPITEEDVQVIDSLNLAGLYLTSLDGIEYLTSLTELNLSETGISDISNLSTLTELQYLYLAHNDITDISVISNLLNLRELDLNDNLIEDISPLIWLWNKNLTVLKLGNNKILDLTVLEGLTSLEVLELQHNRILTIEPLQELKTLRVLNLSGNKINDITPISGPYSSLDNLEVLNLSSNEISDIDNLVWLWENGILRELYLANNFITEIEVLYGLNFLEIIDLSHNDIIDLGVFKTMVGVRELYLNGNRIEDITNLRNLTYLEILHLHENQIIAIDTLLDLLSLEFVTLWDNPPLDFQNRNPDTNPTWAVIEQLQNRNVTVIYFNDNGE